MPTPVSSARQCLTDEAARALDDAVAVARRRGHAQTTSLHAISALLSLPSSLLRDACARARSSAYSPRLQFRALELSVGVSLDRLSSSKSVEDPPVANSLMAAIKRSQANQRRHPDSFHLHQLQIQQQHQQQSTMSLSIVKVELKHFVLSILDDPIVSKVFGEAGFRSYDIKLAILNPPAPPLPRFSGTHFLPPFMSNLPWGNSNLGARGFSFPLPSSSSFSGSANGDENCRRIGEVLVKKKGKNPLLIGVCASDALGSFVDFVQKGKDGVLPDQISGLKLICVKKDVSEFVAVGGNQEQLDLKFKELGTLAAEHCSGPGVAVSFGELGMLVADSSSGDALSHVVSKLTDLLKLHGEKLWLIGAAESYEIYSKFLSRFPHIEKDWDLHLLPITSSGPSAMEGLYPKSSLMGSFVPFGGFFSMPSDFKSPLSCVIQSDSRCHSCNEKYEQEVSATLKRGSGVSVSDQYSATLPSWLQMGELDTGKAVDAAKIKNGGEALDAKIMAVQRKWNDNCQRLHHAKSFPLVSCSQPGSQVPGAEEFRFVADGTQSSSSSLNENQCTKSSHCAPVQLIGQIFSKQKMPIPVSQSENTDLLRQLEAGASQSQQSGTRTPWFPPKPQSNLNLLPGRTLSSSVTTDLQLGMQYASTSQEPKNTDFEAHEDRVQHFSASVSATYDVVSEKTSENNTHASSHSTLDMGGQFDPRDFKILWTALSEKVGRQEEAVRDISQTVSLCRTGNIKHGSSNLKGDIWLSLLGPDKLGKKRIATALAETIFGSSKSLISVDMSNQYGFPHSNSIFHCQESNNYDVNFRGKTVADYIAGELRRKPHSVVFLENVDKADLLAQSSLSQAIRTGKFPDTHGRVVSINNTIFITTSSTAKSDKNFLPEKMPVEFSEERILSAKSWQMQILVKSLSGDSSRNNKGTTVLATPNWGLSNAPSQRKRKLIDIIDSAEENDRASKSYLDLNLPVEEMQESNDIGISDSYSANEISDTWLKDFYDKVKLKVVLCPFDFDALAEKVLKEINSSFQKTMGCEALLEIDREVMVQILAAVWQSERKRAVEDWIERVLSHTFTEAKKRYSPTAQCVLKLVAREGLTADEWAPGIHLPANIILN